jgi:predicted amidophosphoribosyltransferase
VVFPVATHDRELRRAIAGYKYRRREWLADIFAAMLADYLHARMTWFEDFDLLAGVPAYRGGGGRGWDPVGLILERLAGRLDPGWDVVPDLLVKRAETPRMQGRSWSSRQMVAVGPLRRALLVGRPRKAEGARILVFDDVMTEGGTLREVARCLRAAGAAEVAGLVLTRPSWAEPTPMV